MENNKLLTGIELPGVAQEGQTFLMLDTGETYKYIMGNWDHIGTAVCDF